MKKYLPLMTLIAIGGCGGGSAPQFAPEAVTAQSCGGVAALSIPNAEIGSATSGADIKSATMIKATDTGNVNGDFCKVLGTIKPSTAGACRRAGSS